MSGNEELSVQAEGNSIATISYVAKTGKNQIDSLLSGVKWGENNVTFSFATSSADYPSSYTTNNEPNCNFVALNDAQQAAAREALQAWGNVCNLAFTETTGGDGSICFGTSSKPTTSWAYFPSLSEVGGDVWFGNSGRNAPTDPSPGNYDYATYIHEIGHALGLKHPHGTDGSHVIAASSFDTIEYSVMSYRSYVGAGLSGYTIAEGSFPAGPMIDDIAAMQKMYGVNYNYNSGDNVYKFDPTDSKIFETIWDGGGNDTYDLSAYTTNLRIDLQPGGWSTLNSSQLSYLGNGHYARGNVANALLYNNSTQSIIENAIGGSGNDLIYGNQVDNVLNGGAGLDTLTGGLGNDTYIVDNTGDKIVENAKGGTDIVQTGITYTLGANVEILTLTGSNDISGTGNALNNLLTGNSGKNTINGGLGNDTLDGGLGADTLTGGAGNDTYIVDSSDTVVENINGGGADTIQAGFSYTLGANVENLALTGSNNLNGTGNSINNVLTGNSGKNMLDGGLGADKMAGGTGDDTYIVDNTGDIVIEGISEGTDTVAASVSYTLAANVETLTLTGIGNINGTGNAIDNTINGNTGNNVLNGDLGADTLVGGLGNDSYVIDAYDVVKENANGGIDTVYSSLADYHLVSNVENLALSGKGNINGTGNEMTNTITGNSGNNVLDGGLGADTLIGGAGNDIYIMDTTIDVITEIAAGGIDTVQTSINNYTLAANVENLILTGSANLNGTGNALNNFLTGNSGSNMLAGGGGNDTLDGGLGADTLAGGLGNDIYIAATDDTIVENAKEGTDTIQADFSYTLGKNLENLTLTDSGNINGTGNTLSNVITGNSGNNMLDGGLSADTLTGGAGDDTYVVDSIGDKVVEAADGGNDIVESSVSYTLTANVEKLILTGSGNINGIGNALNNTINGNAGNNRLDGGLGADTMSGGLGDDIYMIDNASDAVKENANEGTDIVYTVLNNYQLADNVENLILSGKGSISTIGNALNNMLTGNSGNNTLNGGAGDDTLNGGLGVDTLVGGTGNDTYVVDNTGDKVSENANEGIDTVQSGISYTLGANLENLILTSNCTTGTGNELNNTITGNSVSNILSGGSGNDTLDGGLGADKLLGGSGDDTYIVDNAKDLLEESINAGTDIVKSSVSYTLTNNVENLFLTGTGNISATGNALSNTINGNTGNNVLDGGLGADTLVGGLGNDSYMVDASDVVKENTDEGTDTVYAGFDYSLGDNIENLALSGTGNFNGTGNALTNVIKGNNGSNILNGGLGADTLIGGLGNDTYVVDSINDSVVENLNGGTDIVQAGITYTLAANVENLTLTGSSDINGTGNALNNVLTGNGGKNTLNGGLGNDTLDGGLGADTLTGGAGNDTYIVDSADTVVENINGGGADTIQAGFSYTLGANVENLALTGSSDLNGTGNSINNVLTGNSGKNTLDGGLGADRLAGGTGDDTYIVDNISDIVIEGTAEGTDTIAASVSYTLATNVEILSLTGTGNINGTGNALDNTINGNAGNNVLDGGLGADTLAGGLGNDSYMIDASDVVKENADEGTDTVYAGFDYSLGDNIENLALSGTGNFNGTGNALTNIITGNKGNNILNGGLGADKLVGGLGNDTYVVDSINDSVVENLNGGTDIVQAGITYTLAANVENLTLSGSSDINGTGNALNNVLTGNSGKNTLNGGLGKDTLDGGLGADTLAGGAGNDTYIVDSADTVVENINGGADTIQASFSYTLGANVENLTLTGSSDISGTGNALNNVLTGNSGKNTLNGGLGNDTLYGGAGGDNLEGGLGDDTYILGIGAGNDTIISYEGLNGNGVDTIIFQNLAMASIELTKNANDLICTLTQTGEKVDLQNWFLGSNYEIDKFKFSDGTLTSAQVDKKFA